MRFEVWGFGLEDVPREADPTGNALNGLKAYIKG